MKTISFILLWLVSSGALAGEPKLSRPSLVAQLPGRDGNTVLFGAGTLDGRLGLTKPTKVYRLHHPYNLCAYYFSGPYENPIFDFGEVTLTHPDGTITKFPPDIWDGFGPEPTLRQRGFGGIGLDWQLQKFVEKPGVYKVQWRVGKLESPLVSFWVVRK